MTAPTPPTEAPDLDAIERAVTLDAAGVDACRRIGRDEQAQSTTIALVEFDALCEQARAAPALLAEVRSLREIRDDLVAERTEAIRAAHERTDEIHELRDLLVAARLSALNATAVAGEALDIAAALVPMLPDEHSAGRHAAGIDVRKLRERLAAPDFAERATKLLDEYERVASAEFPGSAKVDKARAALDALLGMVKP